MKLLLVLAVVAYVSCTSYAGPRPKRHADEDRVQYSLNYDSDYGYDVDYSFGAESEGQEESESEEKDVPKEKKEKGTCRKKQNTLLTNAKIHCTALHFIILRKYKLLFHLLSKKRTVRICTVTVKGHCPSNG